VTTGLKRGLYVITDNTLTPDTQLIEAVSLALQGGAVTVQYRDKSTDHNRRQQQASALLDLCKHYQATLIINDDIGLARDIGAHGVHLGKEDNPYELARNELGEDAIIGISCYNDLQRARQFAARGADYVAFGRFFDSTTKPQATAAKPELLSQAKASLGIPIVAIGGITADNGGPLIKAGADLLAVVHGVFGQPDIRSAAQGFNELFDE
jgi:thiamine-phosphate pyrophosphorylase